MSFNPHAFLLLLAHDSNLQLHEVQEDLYIAEHQESYTKFRLYIFQCGEPSISATLKIPFLPKRLETLIKLSSNLSSPSKTYYLD